MGSGAVLDTVTTSNSNLAPPAQRQSHPPSPNTPSYSTFPAPVGAPTSSNALYPPQLQPGEDPGEPAAYDAPPSYEDAIGDDIGPIDGPRREYGDNGGIGGPPAGSKADRLFPDNP
jgi:hypothetical protein